MITQHKVCRKDNTKGGGRIVFFFRDITTELKKVVWPSKREVTYLTIVAIVVSTITGIALGAIDLAFTNLVKDFFLSS